MKKDILTIIVIILFIISALIPIVIGSNIKTYKDKITVMDYFLNKPIYTNLYDYYNADEIPEFIKQPINSIYNDFCSSESMVTDLPIESVHTLNSSLDVSWPMYCHDIRHTGHSLYSTVDSWNEIWRFRQYKNDFIRGGPAIGNDGTIYFGGLGNFYALYPNGTMKWIYTEINFYISSSPAIDENGTIYVGDCDGFFHAINSDGTKKWIKEFSHDIKSSPVIGNDGTIYFGDSDYYINALYPNNGSVKWRYKTGLVVYSSPAIGVDATVYCGSHDTYLYALYSNNGTLKWRYKTGHWIRTSPCIAEDGTIYVVSLDDHLYAINPNGTLKWKTNIGEGGTSPTIGQDGIIYCGYSHLHAIYPNNGSVKWSFDVSSGRTIQGATPCHSIEGIIFFGTHIGNDGGGEIIAVNPDGTERWRKKIANMYIDSAPAIGSDGTIYIGSAWSIGGVHRGYLHAFGKLDPNAPSEPTITGPTSGTVGVEYDYTFKSISPLSRGVYYWIEWGDGKIKEWFGPFSSGEIVTVSHTWSKQNNFTIQAGAKDTDNLWGPWSKLTVTMPRDKSVSSSLFLRFLGCFQILNQLF